MVDVDDVDYDVEFRLYKNGRLAVTLLCEDRPWSHLSVNRPELECGKYQFYAKSWGLGGWNQKVFDALMCENRIVEYKVEPEHSHLRRFEVVDREWKEIIKKARKKFTQ